MQAFTAFNKLIMLVSHAGKLTEFFLRIVVLGFCVCLGVYALRTHNFQQNQPTPFTQIQKVAPEAISKSSNKQNNEAPVIQTQSTIETSDADSKPAGLWRYKDLPETWLGMFVPDHRMVKSWFGRSRLLDFT